RDAEAAGVAVAWGRSWEAGGAPAYWPWIQVLRALGGVDRPALAPLWGRGDAPVTASPERARFELLDAVWRVLDETARARPLLIVLEDVHAADPSSLLLLDLIGHQVRCAPVAVIATFRDSDAHRGEAGPLLLRVARQAQTLALVPFGPGDVAAFLA